MGSFARHPSPPPLFQLPPPLRQLPALFDDRSSHRVIDCRALFPPHCLPRLRKVHTPPAFFGSTISLKSPCMGDKSSGEGPPPPSPLTGAYLLIVLPQTHQPQHKDNVLHNLTKGLLTWDKNDCHVDIEKELQTITAQAPEGEEAKNGERLIQFASENLVTEVLIHPQLNTLVQCMRNLLSSFTRHRHIIHAGYTCAGNGGWMLQDGTFSYADFSEMYQEHEVQRVLRAYENTVTVDIHCLQEGDWNNLRGKDPFSKISRVRLNPKDCLTSTSIFRNFLDYLSPFVTNGTIQELLESSDVVGNIRFSHPTLYVFPGGQGDAALFGINGFNMLVDGGFARKACFWDFSRHLDRLDAVLMTRLNNGNVQGMTSLLHRKRIEHVYPQIGHFFCNLQERKHPLSPDGDKDRDPLLLSLFDQGHDMLSSLRHLQLKPQSCYRDPVLEPINLYHKVGHGKLDMYVISPAKDSREVREFMAKWTTQDSKIFCSFTKRGGEFNFPLCNKVSICALLIWQPANPEDNITRLLFPGSTPQHKIFEGLDKLKNLEFMKHAVCSARTLSPSPSTVGINVRALSKPKVPGTVDKIIENDDKKIEAAKPAVAKTPLNQVDKQIKSQLPPSSRPASKHKLPEKPKEKSKTEIEAKSEKPETVKIEKSKVEKNEKPEAVQKIEKPKEKPKRPISKPLEKKKAVGSEKKEEKKDSLKSSPTTPKKLPENKVAEQTKPETKSRASSKTKPSPSATPAKSAKEANNRKVLEQKKEATRRVPAAKKEDIKKADKPAPVKKSSFPSPSKGNKHVSPVKAPRPVAKPKQDGKKAPKTEKEAGTDSVVSTPSTVDVELVKAKEDMAEKETKPEELKGEEAGEPQSLSKEEDDEILIVEKVEIEGAGKEEPMQSIAVHIRKSREEIIAKDDEVKEEDVNELVSEDRREIMKTSDITIPDTTDSKIFSDEAPEITKDTQDTSKSKVDFIPTEEGSLTKETHTDKLTPKEKDLKEKSTDIGDAKVADESQPDEKFSTTIESGATTAPTLPEDERIPLDEIKEAIEEKHVKEETKEKETDVVQRPEQPTSLPEPPTVPGLPFDQRVHLLKDIVKTPDEVADLPMHEEADGGLYSVEQGRLGKELPKTKDEMPDEGLEKVLMDKKDEAAEEIKLVKDENEKEDITKDLKEDNQVAMAYKSSLDSVDANLKLKSDEFGELSREEKIDLNLGPIEVDEEDQMCTLNNKAIDPSKTVVSVDDDEILDEDKDKETEKEKKVLQTIQQLEKGAIEEKVSEKEDKTEKPLSSLSTTNETPEPCVEVPKLDDIVAQLGTPTVSQLADKEVSKSPSSIQKEHEDSHLPGRESKSPANELQMDELEEVDKDKESKISSPKFQEVSTFQLVTDEVSKSPDITGVTSKSPEIPDMAYKSHEAIGEALKEEVSVIESGSKSPEITTGRTSKSPEAIEEPLKSELSIIESGSKSPEVTTGRTSKSPEAIEEPLESEVPVIKSGSKSPEVTTGRTSKSPEAIEEALNSEVPVIESGSKSPEVTTGRTSKSPEAIEEALKSEVPVIDSGSKSPEVTTGRTSKSPEAIEEPLKSEVPAIESGSKSPEVTTGRTSKSPEAIEEALKSEVPVIKSGSKSPEVTTGSTSKSPEAIEEALKSEIPSTVSRESPGIMTGTSKSPEATEEPLKSGEALVTGKDSASHKVAIEKESKSPETAGRKSESPEAIEEPIKSHEVMTLRESKSPDLGDATPKSPLPREGGSNSPEFPIIGMDSKSPETITDKESTSLEKIEDASKPPVVPLTERDSESPEVTTERESISPEAIEKVSQLDEVALMDSDSRSPEVTTERESKSPEVIELESKLPEVSLTGRDSKSPEITTGGESKSPEATEQSKSPEVPVIKSDSKSPEITTGRESKSPEVIELTSKSSEVPLTGRDSDSPETTTGRKSKSPDLIERIDKSPEFTEKDSKPLGITGELSLPSKIISEAIESSEATQKLSESPEFHDESSKSPHFNDTSKLSEVSGLSSLLPESEKEITRESEVQSKSPELQKSESSGIVYKEHKSPLPPPNVDSEIVSKVEAVSQIFESLDSQKVEATNVTVLDDSVKKSPDLSADHPSLLHSKSPSPSFEPKEADAKAKVEEVDAQRVKSVSPSLLDETSVPSKSPTESLIRKETASPELKHDLQQSLATDEPTMDKISKDVKEQTKDEGEEITASISPSQKDDSTESIVSELKGLQSSLPESHVEDARLSQKDVSKSPSPILEKKDKTDDQEVRGVSPPHSEQINEVEPVIDMKPIEEKLSEVKVAEVPDDKGSSKFDSPTVDNKETTSKGPLQFSVADSEARKSPSPHGISEIDSTSKAEDLDKMGEVEEKEVQIVDNKSHIFSEEKPQTTSDTQEKPHLGDVGEVTQKLDEKSAFEETAGQLKKETVMEDTQLEKIKDVASAADAKDVLALSKSPESEETKDQSQVEADSKAKDQPQEIRGISVKATSESKSPEPESKYSKTPSQELKDELSPKDQSTKEDSASATDSSILLQLAAGKREADQKQEFILDATSESRKVVADITEPKQEGKEKSSSEDVSVTPTGVAARQKNEVDLHLSSSKEDSTKIDKDDHIKTVKDEFKSSLELAEELDTVADHKKTDKVPSISLREASIEQLSEESVKVHSESTQKVVDQEVSFQESKTEGETIVADDHVLISEHKREDMLEDVVKNVELEVVSNEDLLPPKDSGSKGTQDDGKEFSEPASTSIEASSADEDSKISSFKESIDSEILEPSHDIDSLSTLDKTDIKGDIPAVSSQIPADISELETKKIHEEHPIDAISKDVPEDFLPSKTTTSPIVDEKSGKIEGVHLDDLEPLIAEIAKATQPLEKSDHKESEPRTISPPSKILSEEIEKPAGLLPKDELISKTVIAKDEDVLPTQQLEKTRTGGTDSTSPSKVICEQVETIGISESSAKPVSTKDIDCISIIQEPTKDGKTTKDEHSTDELEEKTDDKSSGSVKDTIYDSKEEHLRFATSSIDGKTILESTEPLSKDSKMEIAVAMSTIETLSSLELKDSLEKSKMEKSGSDTESKIAGDDLPNISKETKEDVTISDEKELLEKSGSSFTDQKPSDIGKVCEASTDDAITISSDQKKDLDLEEVGKQKTDLAEVKQDDALITDEQMKKSDDSSEIFSKTIGPAKESTLSGEVHLQEVHKLDAAVVSEAEVPSVITTVVLEEYKGNSVSSDKIIEEVKIKEKLVEASVAGTALSDTKERTDSSMVDSTLTITKITTIETTTTLPCDEGENVLASATDSVKELDGLKGTVDETTVLSETSDKMIDSKSEIIGDIKEGIIIQETMKSVSQSTTLLSEVDPKKPLESEITSLSDKFDIKSTDTPSQDIDRSEAVKTIDVTAIDVEGSVLEENKEKELSYKIESKSRVNDTKEATIMTEIKEIAGRPSLNGIEASFNGTRETLSTGKDVIASIETTKSEKGQVLEGPSKDHTVILGSVSADDLEKTDIAKESMKTTTTVLHSDETKSGSDEVDIKLVKEEVSSGIGGILGAIKTTIVETMSISSDKIKEVIKPAETTDDKKTGSEVVDILKSAETTVAQGVEYTQSVVKQSEAKVADVLDTAERIVASLGGMDTISDKTSDYYSQETEQKSSLLKDEKADILESVTSLKADLIPPRLEKAEDSNAKTASESQKQEDMFDSTLVKKVVEDVHSSSSTIQDQKTKTQEEPGYDKLPCIAGELHDKTIITSTISELSSKIPESTAPREKASPGSSTASTDVNRASPIASGKEDLHTKEAVNVISDVIKVTTDFLSMETGASPDHKKAVEQNLALAAVKEAGLSSLDKTIQFIPGTTLKAYKEFSRSDTPASDIMSDRDIELGRSTPHSDLSSGQVSRAITNVWETIEGRPESRHYDSDEDIPGSPLSISSHIPSPPQFEYDISKSQDPMMTSSFYGSLPGDIEDSVKKFTGELESAYELSGVSLGKELLGKKGSLSFKSESSGKSTAESSPLPERRMDRLSTKEDESELASQPLNVLPSSSSQSSKTDPIEKWDKPLGLPPPLPSDGGNVHYRWNPYKEWGKPLGLPSPAPPPAREENEIEVETSGSAKTTPKKVSKMNAENNKYSANAIKDSINKSKRSESPVKKPSTKESRKSGPTPVYVDLSYVPHHGNSNYASVEFFKRVRARYYVFSGTEPSKEVFNALLEAKQSWEDKDLEVTIIPTYDTDTLGYWIAENEEMLSKLKIDLSPSASRCTINLQDHDTSCSAYRLEF